MCSGVLTISGCYSLNGYVMNASGQSYYSQGNYSLAAQEFQTALQSSPTNPDYMTNLAKARQKMGDARTAEQLYRQALAVDPSHQPSYHGLSEILVQQNRSQEALRLLNTWAATQPYIAESHLELAWLQRELGQPDAAAQSLQMALQANPNHATALAHLGQYYQDRGQPAQAVAMFQRSLQADWNQPEVHSRMASAADSAGANHPMGEVAMARGVHPHMVAGVQPGLNSGYPMPTATAFAPVGFPQPQPWQQAQFSGAQVAMYQPPVAGPGIAANAGSPYVGMPSGMMPMTGFSFGGGEIVNSISNTISGTNVQPVEPAAAMPIPDPAFSTSTSGTTPVTTISQSQSANITLPVTDSF